MISYPLKLTPFESAVIGALRAFAHPENTPQSRLSTEAAVPEHALFDYLFARDLVHVWCRATQAHMGSRRVPWSAYFQTARFATSVQIQEWHLVRERLLRRGIRCVLIKNGLVSGLLDPAYPRLANDLDILVPAERIEEARATILDAGYRTAPESDERTLVEASHYEIHPLLKEVGAGRLTHERRFLARYCTKTFEVSNASVRFNMRIDLHRNVQFPPIGKTLLWGSVARGTDRLPTELSILIGATRAYHELSLGDLRAARSLADVVVLLTRAGSVDYDALVRMASMTTQAAAVYHVMRVARDILKIPFPAMSFARLERASRVGLNRATPISGRALTNRTTTRDTGDLLPHLFGRRPWCRAGVRTLAVPQTPDSWDRSD